MAAISLGFIVIVTPYTIQEVVAACTGSKVTLYLFYWLMVADDNMETLKKNKASQLIYFASTSFFIPSTSCQVKLF